MRSFVCLHIMLGVRGEGGGDRATRGQLLEVTYDDVFYITCLKS